jgi:hypothetical protein
MAGTPVAGGCPPQDKSGKKQEQKEQKIRGNILNRKFVYIMTIAL